MRNVSRTTRIAIFVAVILVAILIGSILQPIKSPFKGQFKDVPITEVKGTLETAKLFCDSSGCKWLWSITVEEVIVINEGLHVLPEPEAGRLYTFDIPDSKANNYVETLPAVEYTSGPVTIKEHVITSANVVIYYYEEVGSSGLPELKAAVY